VIQITAERFSFTPSEIVLEPGEEVEFRLKSDDTSHGFRVVGHGVNVAIPKRGRDAITVNFKAPEPGRYTFECSRMCGAGHNFMRGVLVVRERAGQSGKR
jgi:cytochrome c oxidase subunit II